MEYKEYQLQQLDEIKMRLSAKKQLLKSKGYDLLYDAYCEADLNDAGEEVSNRAYIQIIMSLLQKEIRFWSIIAVFVKILVRRMKKGIARKNLSQRY